LGNVTRELRTVSFPQNLGPFASSLASDSAFRGASAKSGRQPSNQIQFLDQRQRPWDDPEQNWDHDAAEQTVGHGAPIFTSVGLSEHRFKTRRIQTVLRAPATFPSTAAQFRQGEDHVITAQWNQQFHGSAYDLLVATRLNRQQLLSLTGWHRNRPRTPLKRLRFTLGGPRYTFPAVLQQDRNKSCLLLLGRSAAGFNQYNTVTSKRSPQMPAAGNDGGSCAASAFRSEDGDCSNQTNSITNIDPPATGLHHRDILLEDFQHSPTPSTNNKDYMGRPANVFNYREGRNVAHRPQKTVGPELKKSSGLRGAFLRWIRFLPGKTRRLVHRFWGLRESLLPAHELTGSQ